MMMKLNTSHCWNDYERVQPLAGGYGQTAAASEVVAVGIGSPLEQAEDTQAVELAGQSGRRKVGQQAQQIAPSQAVDVELRALDGAQQSLIMAIEEIEAFERAVAIGLGLGDAFEQALPAENWSCPRRPWG